MRAFVAIHTKGFSASYWTQQEVGFAVGRGTKIISLRMREDPTGFISKHQALQRMIRKAEAIAKEIEGLLRVDAQTGTTMSEVIRANLPVLEQELDDEIPF